MADLLIIIVNYNTKNLTIACLDSIFKQKWQKKIEVWVVDNASMDGSVNEIKKHFSKVKIIASPNNLGFAGGNNLMLGKSDARYYLLLNSDTEVLPQSLDKLVDFMNQGFGICSCKIIDMNNNLQPNVGDLPNWISVFTWLSGLDDILVGLRGNPPSFHRNSPEYYKENKNVGWVSGSAMIIKKEVVEKVGLLDENIFMYGEDTEYCLRAQKAGYKIGWTNKAQIKHLGGASSKDSTLKQWAGEFKGLLYLYQKHYGVIARFILKIWIVFFIMVRIVVFLLLGKPKISKTYVEIFKRI